MPVWDIPEKNKVTNNEVFQETVKIKLLSYLEVDSYETYSFRNDYEWFFMSKML